MSEAGISTGIIVAPMIPVLTDGEMEAILGLAKAAGVRTAGTAEAARVSASLSRCAVPPSPSVSFEVKMRTTPGMAAAALVSMPSIFACACGERRI